MSINDQIREHELRTPWQYHEMAQECYRFFDIFNREFFDGALPTCFLVFTQEHKNILGYYRPGRNAVAAEHEIALNTRYLGRPLQETLCTLLHEMTHEWQDLFGKPGKGAYHNQQFTEKCNALGIPCTGGRRSVTIGTLDPFVSLLRRNGIESDTKVRIPDTDRAIIVQNSRMRLWICACGIRVRCAVGLDAQCLKCGDKFTKA